MAPLSIDILLATYNGAAFLGAQIESLLVQEGVSFRILIRDDGSTDETPAIIERYCRLRPDCFVCLETSGNIGAVRNFAALLARAEAPYVALCDQDDVWMPHKLRVQLEALREMERRDDVDTPLLVHSDLRVVDENLRQRHASYWRYSGCDPHATNLSRLLIRNPVAGCAALINRSLVRLALPVHGDAVVHDHWLTLVATAAGYVGAIEEPLVAYRQHAANIIGARPYDWRSIVRGLTSGLANWDIGRLRRQGAAVLERCRAAMSARDRTIIEDFVSLPERNWISRRWILLRHGILMPGLLRNFALLFFARLGR